MQGDKFDAIVIGGGHAGCEAGLALSRTGHKTLMIVSNLDNIAYLACNPSIGGTAKGHIVREVDALGGEMGVNADATLMQLRMLNLAKGSAVHSLRGQADKYLYHTRMKSVLENQENLCLLQGEVVEIFEKNKKITGVSLDNGDKYFCDSVIVACGVYLKSDIIMGEFRKNIGPSGFSACNSLTFSLLDMGLEIRRFKTGTPARIYSKSIDFSKMEKQSSDEFLYSFSFLNDSVEINEKPCYLTYTTPKTHEIIRENIHRAPMYSGNIKGVGPRYCPSIEDKVVRFASKDRHQVFVEPEGAKTTEMYVQGLSTSMPIDVQKLMYRSVIGLENAEFARYAYAIEYDSINAEQLHSTLQYKEVEGLYFAGQINGSSGYEEAAGQGLLAGINASLYLKGENQLELKRSDSYIGVLVDDLVIKGTQEPYRMMTSRAEYRLHLRQDNADQRLTEIGRRVGLVTDERLNRFEKKMKEISELKSEIQANLSPKLTDVFMDSKGLDRIGTGVKAVELLKRQEITIHDLKNNFNIGDKYNDEVLKQVEIETKYEGYIIKQQQEIAKTAKLEDMKLDKNFDYEQVKGLRIEATQKLNKIKPITVAQAGRISGVSPADITVLILFLKSSKK